MNHKLFAFCTVGKNEELKKNPHAEAIKIFG